MKSQAQALPVEALRQRRDHLARVSRLLVWILPALAVVLVADLSRWAIGLRKELPSVLPNLEELRKPMPEVPLLDVQAQFFQTAERTPSPGQAIAQAPQVLVQEAQWKLKGAMIAGVKRAFLESPDGKQRVWVKEGEQVEGLQVKEIQERAVLLEKDGKVYEIRM